MTQTNDHYPLPPMLPDSLLPKEELAALIELSKTGGGTGLPIDGGWGYSIDDACIIAVDGDNDTHPAVVAVEYEFIEARIGTELDSCEGFVDYQWKLLKQGLTRINGSSFDHFIVEIAVVRNGDVHAYDPETYQRKREALTVRFQRDYWFDITQALQSE